MKKNCRNCGPLPITEFYAAPSMKDGLLNICKTCYCAERLAYYYKVSKRSRYRAKMPKQVITVEVYEPEPFIEDEEVWVEPLSFRGVIDIYLRVGKAA